MDDKRCFVQFPDPGGEHRPDQDGHIGWNPRKRNGRGTGSGMYSFFPAMRAGTDTGFPGPSIEPGAPCRPTPAAKGAMCHICE